MSELPLRARVAAAKALLEASSADDYDALPPVQRAHFEEALEFLSRIENELPAEGRLPIGRCHLGDGHRGGGSNE